MTAIAIRAEGLSKRYTIGERMTAQGSLRDALAARFQNGGRAESEHSFWALRDVSFDVRQGEVLGVVGRNGAGKSTLLKLISRITTPTAGRAEIYGRVGSLLDVGTGFHPELTGRENIFLNGAILGMTRQEIRRQFDEIVAFAGVERFLDTPVKRYSSGMYVRLAFAVAAHLETEILIVDEVLAVGDVAFQQKCIGKMSEVTRQGRTILFVSHNVASIQQLAHRCLLIDAGRLVTSGPTADVVRAYLDSALDHAADAGEADTAPRLHPALGQAVRIVGLDLSSHPARAVPAGEPLQFTLALRAPETQERLRLRITLYWLGGREAGTAISPDLPTIPAGSELSLSLEIPDPQLAAGRYQCVVALMNGATEVDSIRDVLPFEVLPPHDPDGMSTAWRMEWGPVRYANATISSITHTK